jgi:transposase
LASFSVSVLVRGGRHLVRYPTAQTVAEPGRNVKANAGLNREILASGWGLLVRRLDDKGTGRIEKVKPAYTSQRCSACGCVDPKSRES